MSKVHRHAFKWMILTAAFTTAACDDTGVACICPGPAPDSAASKTALRNAEPENLNLLASFIDISRKASRQMAHDAMPVDSIQVRAVDESVRTDALHADNTGNSNSADETALDPGDGMIPDKQAALAKLTASVSHSATVGAAMGAKPHKVKKVVSGMPRNSHQVPEGYWIGSKPAVENLKPLHDNHIKLIVTASRMGEEDLTQMKEEIEALGMKQLNIPFGGKFPKPEKFMNTIKKYKPDEIYIHCDHGGDRSGAVLAFLLVKEQGWSIPRALFAVIYPGPNDINGLNNVLKDRGFDISENEFNDIMGMYSAENNGGFGGLKVRSHNYRKLVNTLIDAMIKSRS